MKKIIILFLLLANLSQGQAQSVRGLYRVSGSRYGGSTVAGVASNTVTITVTYASPPISPSATFAPLKYNKLAWFQYERDDLLSGTWTDYVFFNGGTAADGKTYPGKTFTDGCGNKVKWRGSVVSNARSNFNNIDLWGTTGRLTTQQVATMIKTGKWGILNHGYYHEIATTNNFYPPWSATFSQAGWDVTENQKFTYTKLKSQDVEYLMRCVVVPTNYPGFTRGADSLKYLGSTSTNSLDGYDGIPRFFDLNTANNGGNFAQDETMPVTGYSKFNNAGFVQYTRNFQDSWTTSIVNTLKAQFVDLLAKSNANKHLGMRLGTHTGTYPEMSNFFNYADSIAADRVWFVGMTEQLEYREVKRLAQKTQFVNGNRLVIRLDLSAVPDVTRFRDMSLLITGGQITHVTVSGVDSFSYDTATGLVNVFTEKTKGFPTP
ncbi:hypothetical protein [Spirosoma sp.]|uniref:hypothetical protein n=1 Tax=Spirosoma sp. TaxID=1899569 RepID=UPI0026256579|nr:hypothetical protein [Spirosoma sp.]MCX6212885.1 hypothetical protein [Spirosoma sp.]